MCEHEVFVANCVVPVGGKSANEGFRNVIANKIVMEQELLQGWRSSIRLRISGFISTNLQDEC